MKAKQPRGTSASDTLRKAALRQPDVEQAIACRGTALESASFKVRGKAFLFLRPTTAMLKLGDSLAEATRLAVKEPALCKVGSGAWVTIALDGDNSINAKVLAGWVAESYSIMVTPKVRKKATGK
jgi:hypothetical protein